MRGGFRPLVNPATNTNHDATAEMREFVRDRIANRHDRHMSEDEIRRQNIELMNHITKESHVNS